MYNVLDRASPGRWAIECGGIVARGNVRGMEGIDGLKDRLDS
jgi:hypothetical protein